MQVQVKHGLPTEPVAVHDQPVAILGDAACARQLGGHPNQMPQHLLVFGPGNARAGEMLFGQHQEVHRRLGMEVLQNEALLVLEDRLSGGLVAQLAEETVHGIDQRAANGTGGGAMAGACRSRTSGSMAARKSGSSEAGMGSASGTLSANGFMNCPARLSA